MKWTIFLAVILALGACSAPRPGTPEYAAMAAKQKYETAVANAEKTRDEAPGWYLQQPTDGPLIYGVAMASSTDLDLAIRKAVLEARGMIAEKISATLDSRSRSYVEDSSGRAGSRYDRTTTQEVVRTVLADCQTVESKVVVIGDGFKAWIQQSCNVGEIRERQAAAAGIEKRAAQALADLEKAVRNHEVVAKAEPPAPAAAPRVEVSKD